MISKKLLIGIASAFVLVAIATTVVAAPLPNGTLLSVTTGTGSEVNTQCATGSCFSMEVAPGINTWTTVVPGTDGGFILGKDQVSGGQEGPLTSCNTTPGELSAAWSYFSCYGTFFTAPNPYLGLLMGAASNLFDDADCTLADCLGKTELNAWYAAWGGYVIPMGSGYSCDGASCSVDQQAGISIEYYTIDPTTGGDWSIYHKWVVPHVDGGYNGFEGVRFGIIMRGTVTLEDPCDGVICDDGDACTDDSCAEGICASALNCLLAGCDTDPRCVPSPLPDGTKLSIEQGVGSDVNVPCTTGSCFSMEVGPGLDTWTDFGPGTDGGFILGKDQVSGGQELAPSGSNSAPGELTNAWFYFNNFGTFATTSYPALDLPVGASANLFDAADCTLADCLGKTELNAWYVAWNGGVTVLGSGYPCNDAGCYPDLQAGISIDHYSIDPTNGGDWGIYHKWVVPAAPNSSFGGVRFGVIMRGTVTLADSCDGVICDDNNPCTTDTCDPVTGCVFTPVQCIDESECTDNWCDPATGECMFIMNDLYCEDNDPCTIDRCENFWCTHVPVECNDNNSCTTDSCDSTTASCVYAPVADGTPCPEAPSGICQSGVCVLVPGCDTLSVTLKGGGQKGSVDAQIQTTFAVTNASAGGCIIAYSKNSIQVTPCTDLKIDWTGSSPSVSEATLNRSSIPVGNTLFLNCVTSTNRLILDNKGMGGRDTDRIFIKN